MEKEIIDIINATAVAVSCAVIVGGFLGWLIAFIQYKIEQRKNKKTIKK